MSQHCCHDHDHAPRSTTPELAAIATSAEPRWSSLRIDAMDCPTEERLIRDALGKVQAIDALEFNLMQRLLRVRHRFEDVEPLQRLIESLGMQAVPSPKALRPAPRRKRRNPGGRWPWPAWPHWRRKPANGSGRGRNG